MEKLQPRPLNFPFSGSAAVLMPVIIDQGRPLLLLTNRSHRVGTHKGQISFPGGMQDTDESPATTALRETEEELGIPRERIELAGRFHDYVAVTGWKVMTFVGFLAGNTLLQPNPDEVAEVIRAPLDFFARTRPRVVNRFRLGRKVPIYFYDFGNEVVWGLTAAIIHDFVETLDL
ncbi:MAG: NUDIX hydrolase [Acidobacteriota bacterium]